MPDELKITDVKIRLLDSAPGGVIAMASCVVGGRLYLNDIAIRRSGGGFALSFPYRYSRSGRKHQVHCPVTREARSAFEEAILAGLDLRRRPERNGGDGG